MDSYVTGARALSSPGSSYTSRFASTTACICCSPAVTVFRHLHAGMCRSYNSSISAAERLRSPYVSFHFCILGTEHCLVEDNLPFGLRKIKPQVDTDGDGEGGVDEASPQAEGEEHRWGSIARLHGQSARSCVGVESYQVAIPIMELLRKVKGPVLTACCQ